MKRLRRRQGQSHRTGPARPVFRSNADMMLLTTRLQIDASGKPRIPGNVEVWKDLSSTTPR